MPEGYTTLGYLAGQTERIRLGMLVTGVMYRYPGVLAKTVTTLDVLSGGRAALGLGDAWYEREHTGLDVPYPALGERFERLEETFQICLRMWGDDNGAYRVSTTNSPKTSCVPSPIQRPRPPIIIGGGGERKTLRLVARYADIWSAPGGASPADIRRKIAVLADHYAAESHDRRRTSARRSWFSRTRSPTPTAFPPLWSATPNSAPTWRWCPPWHPTRWISSSALARR